jgi:outer membrane protein OmpA-like peptidoglycan-associated protein
MKGAAYWCSALGVMLLVASASVHAQTSEPTGTSDVTDRDRLWANFTREAAVVGDRNFWIELRGLKLQEYDTRLKLAPLTGYPVNDFENKRIAQGGFPIDQIDAGRFDLVGAYGIGQSFELGLDLPFVTQQQIDFQVPDSCVQGVDNCDSFADFVDVGDLLMYGKFKRELMEHWAGAVGLEMSVPTGNEDKLTGSGELGLNPFLSTRYQSGRVAVGGHVGFLLNTNEQPDVFNWSVSGIVRGSPLFALRIEFNGRLLRDFGDTFNDISIYPGIDFNLTENIIIRPQGIAGITDEAVDWGLGLGIVFAMLTPPAAAAPPPPPPPPAPVAAPPPAPVKKKIVLRGVNFDFDKSNIRPDAVPVLETACETLKSEPTIDVSCDGYTDSVGTEEYNQRLSERRAEAVRDWLVQCGIASSRLTTRGFGESNPVASNETEEGRAQNRRTELVVTNQ